MDTRLLRSFRAVAVSGSFTVAATELGYTQSTITAHVQRLEQQLGGPLLDRLPGGVVVTSIGAEALVHAEEILAAEDRLRAATAAENERPCGTVRVMASETLCTYWLPNVILDVKRVEPGVHFWLTPGGIADAIDAVRRGTVDLAVTMEMHAPATDMTIAHIGTQPLLFLDRGDLPTRRAAIADAQTWAMLASRDALLIEEGCGYSDHVAQQLSASGTQTGASSRFGSVEAIKHCVSVGLGWTVLPTIAVESEIQSGALTVLNGPALADCPVTVVSNPRRFQSSATRVALDKLCNSWPEPRSVKPAIGNSRPAPPTR